MARAVLLRALRARVGLLMGSVTLLVGFAVRRTFTANWVVSVNVFSKIYAANNVNS
jgi:hypothetical protein